MIIASLDQRYVNAKGKCLVGKEVKKCLFNPFDAGVQVVSEITLLEAPIWLSLVQMSLYNKG